MTTSAVLNPQFVGAQRKPRRIARLLPATARFVLGACFFVFGLNGFLNFIPPPSAPPPAGAMAFAGALLQTGYMFPLIKGTEVVAGALLLANRFAPLALALLAPVVLNIVLFHALLAPTGSVIAGAVLVLEVYLAWAYRGAFAPMLAAKVTPVFGKARR
jgi:uncharacterized membrane protein YphA (DoxX/SURF4 family)